MSEGKKQELLELVEELKEAILNGNMILILAAFRRGVRVVLSEHKRDIDEADDITYAGPLIE